MRWIGQACVVLGLVAAPAAATGAEIVSVIQGDLLLARIGDKKLLLEVAGIWVPAPGGLAKVAQYRGDEARELAVATLASGTVRVDFLPARSPDGLLQIRVRIGGDSPRDLAVVLAEAGLAMSDGQVMGAPELGAGITAAERQARRARRGLHDGGFQSHEMARASLVDLGLKNYLLASERAARDLAGSGAAPETATWAQPSEYGLHSNPASAIRDWGSSMGLPPDSSRAGH
jgi:endonuclease YncB( thermonuclease family)